MTSLIDYKEYLLNNMDSALYRAIHSPDAIEWRIHMAAYVSFRDALDALKSAMIAGAS